jgi:predicted DNA binding CopG/RHH family protein
MTEPKRKGPAPKPKKIRVLVSLHPETYEDVKTKAERKGLKVPTYLADAIERSSKK